MDSMNEKEFEELSLVKQINVIDDVLSRYVLPIVEADGGKIEIVGLKQEGNEYELNLKYIGSCAFCSSLPYTVRNTEEVLNIHVSKKIKVKVC